MLVPNEDFLNLRDIRSTANPTLFSMSAEDSQIRTQVEILEQDWLIDRTLDRLQEKQEKRSAGMLRSPLGSIDQSAPARSIPPPNLSAAHSRKEDVKSVKENLRIEPSHRSRIVNITYDSKSPSYSADIVNTLAETFIEQNTEARLSSIKETRELLQKQLLEQRAKLLKAEAGLNHFSQASGLLLTTGAATVAENRLRLLQEELSRAEADRIVRESLIADSSLDQFSAVAESDLVRQYRTSLTDLRRQVADLGSILTPENYKVSRLNAQIKELEAAIETELAKGRERIKSDFESSQRREAAIARSLSTQADHVSDLSSKMLRYQLMKGEFDATQKFYDSIAEQLNQTGIALSIRPSDARLLTPAEIPTTPYGPVLPMYAAAGTGLGLCFGVAFVAWKERGGRRLRKPGEAEVCLGIPELGAIPTAQVGARGAVRRLISGPRPGVERMSLESENSDLSECFRGALVSILSPTRTGQTPRSILVTSALPVEGKTTVASNIAITLSQANRDVLLIDADLRRPRLHDIFRLDNSRGLSEILVGDFSIQGMNLNLFLQRTPPARLHVMTSGATNNRPSRLLHSSRFEELMARLLQKFEYVLIDAPPCLKFADARILARHVDGVLLVVRANYTYDKSAAAAAQCFLVDGTPVLGTILNDWDPRMSPAYGFDSYATHYGNN
jgi:capsular exopolysaccharide synthesis family protein